MKLVKFKRPDGRSLNFEIARIQPATLQRNTLLDRHRHEYFSIILIEQGRSVQEIDFTEYTLKKNQLVFIPEGAIHRELGSAQLLGYHILFKDNFFSQPMIEMVRAYVSYAILQRKLILKLTEKEAREFRNLAMVMEQEQNQPDHQNITFILQNLLLAWLNKMESIGQKLTSPNVFITNSILFQKFIALLDEYYRMHQDVSFYCDKLRCTPKKLSAAIKEITGKSTSHVIIDTVLLEAKRHLSFSDLSIKEIASLLGYENQFYFSRIFKAREKIGPEAFRKKFGL